MPYSIEFEGNEYAITPAFDNVLNMYEVLEQADAFDQMDIAHYYLTDGKAPKKAEVIQLVFGVLFPPVKRKTAVGPKSFDYIQDSSYIYAAFMQAYGIDLIEQQGKMHWWKFNSLLQGLPSDTRFMEIISIRTQPLPKPTKYNAEERQRLLRLKQEYALTISEAERQKNLQEGFTKMAHVLLTMAKQNETKG